MAYTTPRTWVTGELVTAALLNTHVRDNLNAAFPLGIDAWTTWAPTITQSNTPTKTTNRATYQRIGRLIIAMFDVTFTSPGSINNNVLTTLPVNAAASAAMGGSFRYFDTGATNHAGTVVSVDTTHAGFVYDGYGNLLGNGDLIIANGDFLQATLIYEAAT